MSVNQSIILGFASKLVQGMERRSISKPSEWALSYRRGKDGSGWSYARGPWSREMHDSTAPENCCRKGAQLWVTETCLSIAMFANDVLKEDVLYVLPTLHPDATGFSSGRFDAACLANPYLNNLYAERNVGLKRAGTACTYIRGSQSRAALKSVPVSRLFLDEYDEHDQDNIPLARERVSGQRNPVIWEVSTPTVEKHGIEESFAGSTQERFFFPCPGCGQHIDLNYPENLVVIGDDPGAERVNESFLKCHLCNIPLPHDQKHIWLKDGVWVAQAAGRTKRGFYVNQLYSTTVTPGVLAAGALKATQSEIDEQEFYNSKLGLPHTPKGASISEADIEDCKGDHLNGAPARDAFPGDQDEQFHRWVESFPVITMGVDQGLKNHHYEVCGWKMDVVEGEDLNTSSVPVVLQCGHLKQWGELDALMNAYHVTHCVVDAMPERRNALEFCLRFWGRVTMCLYPNGITGRMLNERNTEDGEPMVSVDRTSWLDLALGRLRRSGAVSAMPRRTKIILPRDLPHEYVYHMTSIARIPKRDHHGNPINTYITPGRREDHLAHARNYAEIAFAIGARATGTHHIENPI